MTEESRLRFPDQKNGIAISNLASLRSRNDCTFRRKHYSAILPFIEDYTWNHFNYLTGKL